MLHAERGICARATAPGERAAGRHDRRARAASTTARCRSSRRRIPYFEVFRPAEGRTARGHDRQRRRRRDLRLGPRSRSTPRRASPGRSPTRSSPASTISRDAVLDRRCARRRRDATTSTSRTTACGIYAIGYPRAHAVRSPRPPRRADDARRRGLRARAARRPRCSRALARAAAAASAARCCARSARASTASCSSRSCSRRSSRS